MIEDILISDIPELMDIRNSVQENVLSNPNRFSESDYAEYIFQRGFGLLYRVENLIQGFAVIDLQKQNIWALFVRNGKERKGLGRELHNSLLKKYFSKQRETLNLSTEPNTYAEKFYEIAGWEKVGKNEDGEIVFLMSAERYESLGSEGAGFYH